MPTPVLPRGFKCIVLRFLVISGWYPPKPGKRKNPIPSPDHHRWGGYLNTVFYTHGALYRDGNEHLVSSGIGKY